MFSSLKQPRTYVKFAVSQVYYVACTTVSITAINAVVDPETESEKTNVELAGVVVGSAIWWKTSPHVTAVVDKLADRRLARKEAKKMEQAIA